MINYNGTSDLFLLGKNEAETINSNFDHNNENVKEFELIYDPLPVSEGGFKRGSSFSRYEVFDGLSRFVFGKYTTFLNVKDNSEYIVDIATNQRGKNEFKLIKL